MTLGLEPSMKEHLEVVEPHHRFSGVFFKGQPWNLSHLDAFALLVDPGLGFNVDVVVLFSCHCFSHSFKRDGREQWLIPLDEIYDNGRERRVLSPKRYEFSKELLPRILKELSSRNIQVAASDRQNFVTFEEIDEQSVVLYRYAVYFEPTRDRRRKKRIVLQVQSAYVLDGELTKRQQKAGKVNFHTLLRKVYKGEKING